MGTGSGELQKIEALFNAALAVDGAERERLLSCQPPEVRAEVEALLEEDRRGSVVSRAVRSVATSLAKERLRPSPIGTRVGAYEITKELGSGGMGSVYLGVRADETYQRQVAIKFVRAEYDTAMFRERFQHERRILGRLDHINIARLLDAGSTASGQPYFIMEYVDGEAITRYARHHALTRSARLAIFTKVCDAVQYAHQNLIVHRDLKPGNILVDPSGSPKLLDFGIAKLIGEGGRTDQTVAAGLRIMTPDYASPEHLAGLAVTTASDVYSLGAILMELLLDQKPCHLVDGQDEITPPAALGSDLGGIVRKAMHRLPEARYASASELREDVLRFLNGRPIRARSYSTPERVLHFARRYRGFLAASLAVTCGLAAAAAISLRSAQNAEEARREAVQERNRAETERQRAEAAFRLAESSRLDAVRHAAEASVQRSVALQERNLAHRRFIEQRQLLGNFIDDVQDKMEGLPGGGPAREQSLMIAISYLENMARDRDTDPGVLRNLALAYLRLGDLRSGQSPSASKPDPKVARAYFEKANQILARPEMRSDRDGLRILVRLLAREADLFEYLGDPAKAEAAAEEARRIGRQLWSTASPGDLEGAVPIVRALSASALLAVQHRALDRALEWAQECRNLAARTPENPTLVDFGASCTTMEGRAQYLKADPAKAVPAFRAAIATRERVVLEQPANTRNRRSLMLVYSHLANALYTSTSPASLGDLPGALEALRQVRAHALQISQSEPSDRLARRDVAIASTRYGDLLFAAKQYPAAVEMFSASEAMLEALLPLLPDDAALRNELVFLRIRQARLYEQIPSRKADVELSLRRAIAISEQMLKFPALTANMYINMSAAYIRLGRRSQSPEASELFERARELLDAGRKRYPKSAEFSAFEKREMADLPASVVPKSQ